MSKSLGEVHSSVNLKPQSNFWVRLFTFSGPAFMVSVGYMDPGNWATDIAGGAQFGYKLIWVILLANLMAVLFQTLSARLGIVYGKDLAQACRDHYPKPINFILWIVCEIAIAACDLAEVLGSAIGLYILFGIPLLWGVLITTFDVLILMTLMSFGIRKMEAFILSLVVTIGICFGLEMILSKPQLGQIFTGFLPTSLNSEALFIALGIIGATVMPHNLYLHSALVQSRFVKKTNEGIKEANKFNFIDSVVALNSAFFVNAAILILAASVFFTSGHSDIASIIDAHALLAPLLGSSIAPIAFGIALLAAGQSSTITGTFAGQIVMEGFVGLKMRPWLRRLTTRLLAIIPAVIVIKISGDHAVDSLLILSQVILSIQLPFALIPLLHFTSSKQMMGKFASNKIIETFAWIASLLIITLNVKLVFDTILLNISAPTAIGYFTRFFLIPMSAILLPLLLYLVSEPFIKKDKITKIIYGRRKDFSITTPFTNAMGLTKIGIALEGNKERDEQIIFGAMQIIKTMKASIYLIHCVQTVTAHFIGEMVEDDETLKMKDYLNEFAEKLEKENFSVHTIITGGEPQNEIIKIAKKQNLELIIAGSHGHRFISDLIYGSTINGVRQALKLPVLAIPVSKK
ncbi:MAG: Nramp family divalent metal transporter [Ignavibacteriales bacterium]|nr:Nramp family divalent metal transporter [Ignavibacteriales bacterium]